MDHRNVGPRRNFSVLILLVCDIGKFILARIIFPGFTWSCFGFIAFDIHSVVNERRKQIEMMKKISRKIIKHVDKKTCSPHDFTMVPVRFSGLSELPRLFQTIFWF